MQTQTKVLYEPTCQSLFLESFHFSFQFATSVVSCCPAELKHEVNGKKETLKGFNVKLRDTILFPEGGGQVSSSVFKNYTRLCQFLCLGSLVSGQVTYHSLPYHQHVLYFLPLAR